MHVKSRSNPSSVYRIFFLADTTLPGTKALDSFSIVWTSIRYVTLHFRDRRCAASLRYRNRAEITGSCVQTEALLVSAVVFVSAQKISVIVWTLLKTWAKLFVIKEYVKFKCLNCGIKIFNKMGTWRAGNEFQFPGLFSFQNLGYQIWNPIIRAVVVRKPMRSLWINQRYWLILACVAAGPRIV